MGKSITDQLQDLGLLSERQKHERLAREFLAQEESRITANNSGTKAVEDLDRCESMGQFKRAAKELLLHDSTQIGDVIRKAHRFKNEDEPANKKFIWLFFQIRDALSKTPKSKHKELLTRAFRKHNPTFELAE